jgi:16S rRNA U1498 N3-methylase RsmE
MRKTALLPRERQLGTDQARTRLSKLVAGMGRKRKPSKSLLENAYGIGARRQGGALLIPEIDVLAAMQQIERLEEEAEELAVALLLHERSSESSAQAVPLADVVAELGFSDEDLRQR